MFSKFYCFDIFNKLLPLNKRLNCDIQSTDGKKINVILSKFTSGIGEYNLFK